MRSCLGLALVLAGCASAPVPKAPPGPPAPEAAPPEERPPGVVAGRGPRVVARLLAEDRALLATSRGLAEALPDPAGRARATAEVTALTEELDRLEAPYPSEDGAVLDALVEGLARLRTRATLLHASLRTAAGRELALEREP